MEWLPYPRYQPKIQRMIEVQLLGNFTVLHDGKRLTGFRTNKVRGLLAYLTLERAQTHTRSQLAELFWGDQSEQAARSNLRNALSNIKKVLGGVELYEAKRKTVRLAADFPLTSDVTHFLSADARTAVPLYHGEFLAGLAVEGSATFEAWALQWREKLHLRLMDLLVELADGAMARSAWEEAADWLQRQIAHDSWREDAYRQLMNALWQQGQRTAAIQQYERCRRVLHDELGIAPTVATTTLYERIKSTTQPQRKSNCHLPTPATPFIGRKREQQELITLLQDPNCRLLSLIAPGGMGKTRLAIAVGQQLCPHYRDGVYFVDLVGVAAGKNGLIAAIAAAQGIPFARGVPMGEQLCDVLRSKNLLLILDNMEHFVTAAGWIETLLATAPNVRCLVTSREPLRLAREWRFVVTGLAQSAENPDRNDALQLFIQAARRADPRFTPSVRDAPHLHALCALVGGMPLALELAAMWVPLLSCREIVAELNDLLTTERTDVPARQRSVRAVFDYTWRRFSAEQRTLLARLALFRGSFGRDAAQAITGATLSTLLAFERVGVLQKMATGRYAIHELLRSYAREKSAESAAPFAAYFADWLQDLSAKLHGATPTDSLIAIQQDWHNLTAAWRWLTAHEPNRLRDMLPALHRFFWVRARSPEAVELFLQSAESIQNATLRGELQGHAGYFLLSLGQVERGKTLLDQAIQLAPSAMLQCWRARAMLHLNQFAAARRKLESAESHLKTAYDHATWHAIRGLWHVFTNGDGAIEAFSRTIELLGDDVWPQALSHNDLGLALLNAGEFDRAKHAFQTALGIALRVDSRRFVAVCRGNLGQLALRQAQIDEAEALFAAVVQDFAELGDQLCVAYARNDQGKVALLREKSADAHTYFTQALAISREIGNSRTSADALLGLGQVALAQNDLPAAQTHLTNALNIAPTEAQQAQIHAIIEEHVKDVA